MLNRTIIPEINHITLLSYSEPSKILLPNGIPFYYLNSGETDLVKLEIMFAAGNWYQEEPLIAFAANSAIIEGTTLKNAAQIMEEIEFYGASFGNSVDKDNAYISVLTLHKHLNYVLPLLMDIVQKPAYPETEIEKFKIKHKQQFLIEQTKVSAIARQTHNEKLFGNEHPYGYFIKDADFENITSEKLRKFHKNHYHSGNCKIIASGKITQPEIEIISKNMGEKAWGFPINLKPYTKNTQYPKNQKAFVEKADAVQNAIRIGKILFNKTHEDYAGFSVLNCILGGYFGSRLMKKIREEKGYTYGINSLLVSLVTEGFFTIVSEVGSAVTSDALSDIYSEIEILQNQLVPEDELQRVKNYMMGEMVRMFDGPFAQADNLISLLEYNIGYEHYTQLKDKILTITSAEIQELAIKYLQINSMTEVVVGKAF